MGSTLAIRAWINRLPQNTVVVHGGAQGADQLAGECARQRGLSVEEHPAEWSRYGRAAGPRRNAAMLQTGIDAVYAFRTTGRSPGTDHMVQIARNHPCPVVVVMEDGTKTVYH